MLYSSNKILSSPFESSTSKKKRRDIDRFIPHSVSKNLYNFFNGAAEEPKQSDSSKKRKYQCLLSDNLFPAESSGKVLSFSEEKSGCRAQEAGKENLINLENIQEHGSMSYKNRNGIKSEPYKILDAPCLRDDFYLNLVDWSDNDNIGVGLKSSVYVWSGCTSKVNRVYESEQLTDYICSVSFLRHTPRICAGLTQGKVKIFDLFKSKIDLEFQGLHFGRVGSLGCTHNYICTGGRDGYVTVQDLRVRTEITRYKAHGQEICGLKMCPTGELIATGGNDNKLTLFSMRKMCKMASFQEHRAAVKAIGFSPNEQTIASGGGTADRKLRIFSLQTLKMINQVDTGSQVCSLRFSPVSNELVTTHGYSLNQINLWKCSGNGQVQKIKSIMGHKSRVLYLAGEHAGDKMVTGAGDQELRLWKIFDQKQLIIPYDLR